MAETTPESVTESAATDAAAALSTNDSVAKPAGLPTPASGLLKIRVPVRVTLAAQRKSIQEIRELGPGSIVKFDKTCDEPVELTVGHLPLAYGEVVKVGGKFGL